MTSQRPYDLVKVADALARDLSITCSRAQANELIDAACGLVGEAAMSAVLRSAVTTVLESQLRPIAVVDRFERAGFPVGSARINLQPSILDPESLR